MNFFKKLERKLGRYAIPNLTQYIIITYAIGYLIQFLAPNMLRFLTLEPALILRGEVWRLVSWLLIPPGSSNVFFMVIMLFFYYSLGTTLERTWGRFRYNAYIFGGIVMTLIGAFICYFIASAIYGTTVLFGGAYFSTYYISLSIFLGFAASYPNMQVLLYFIIPIKIKWMAYLDIALLAMDMIQGGWMVRTSIICSLMNFVIFFFMTRNLSRYSPKEVKRRREFTKAVHPTRASNITKHKCAICGRTEEDDPTLEFRFCSKCNGNYEYCQDHLFTHKHVE